MGHQRPVAVGNYALGDLATYPIAGVRRPARGLRRPQAPAMSGAAGETIRLTGAASAATRSPGTPRPQRFAAEQSVGGGEFLDARVERFQLAMREDGHELGAILAE
jgi:hypothetical protein